MQQKTSLLAIQDVSTAGNRSGVGNLRLLILELTMINYTTSMSKMHGCMLHRPLLSFAGHLDAIFEP